MNTFIVDWDAFGDQGDGGWFAGRIDDVRGSRRFRWDDRGEAAPEPVSEAGRE